MLKQGSKIDENGFFIEEIIYDDNQEVEKDIIIVERPQGLYRTKWNGEKWIECATQEEAGKISNNVLAVEPTQQEIIRANLLKDNIYFKLQLVKQQEINANLLTQIAKLGGTQ
jgi:hypothetical protein